MKSVFGVLGGGWSVAAAVAMTCGVVACGSDVGGPQATTSGAAMEGPCEGEGCGDCRPVMIRTVTGKTIEVCGNDDASSEESGDVGRGDHDDDGSPVASDHVDGDHHDDGGLGSEHAMGDASVVIDHAGSDAAVPVDLVDGGHGEDAGADDASTDAGAPDASTADAAEHDASAAESDAAADCGVHP